MIYAITNRKLVSGDEAVYFKQIEKIAAAGPDGIILREKDLSSPEYELYAERCREICDKWGTPLILNHFWEVGKKLDIRRIHLSMLVFRQLSERGKTGDSDSPFKGWAQVGVSVHSLEEAVYAGKAGADYLIAGHIFLTDCKKGVPARGLDFLKEICEAVSIPVFAIGGMNVEHGRAAMAAGASGVCMMSELMESDAPEEIIKLFSGRSEQRMIE
ncbi:thiamine phosphate synthase [Frisingicoccus sp.]|uniref:thiamine phosphate synthase n=1 Tax=Frisingicoccus sp. TaxID=1918627 RepID=UPI003AB1C1FA